MQHNLSDMNIARRLSISTRKESASTKKLASGSRINQAADDAAGLTISEKMRSQIRGLIQASQNAQNGVLLIQTAEGALQEIHEMLQRIGELATEAANGTNSDIDRESVQKEVEQIKIEIDKTATSTIFNKISLLDGSFAKKNVAKTNSSSVATPKLIFHDEVTYEVITTQTPSSYKTIDGYDSIKNALKNQIVPQAVSAVMKTFSNTFKYLEGSSIGIGLSINNNPSSTTLASVRLQTIWENNPELNVSLEFTLSVNVGSLVEDSSPDGLDDISREALESTIAHEMMHALMYEAMTCGMMNKDQSMHETYGFPLWFIEGTAQTVGDGGSWVRTGLKINGSTSEKDITTILQSTDAKLTGRKSKCQYATGYLASMYLGYLANGSTSTNGKDIAKGLDKLLNQIKNGKSLSQAISDNTKYKNIDDFINKFPIDSPAFIKKLMADCDSGMGSLVGDSYKETNLLPDKDLKNDIFKLNTDTWSVLNEYPAGYVVMSGGTKNETGIPPGMKDAKAATPPPSVPIPPATDPTLHPVPNPSTGTRISIPINGSNTGGIYLQIGSNKEQSMIVYIEAMDTMNLGIKQIDISTDKGASDAITHIKDAINIVSSQRADLGAYQNRLEHTIRNLDNATENTQAAESRIRDTDMACEIMKLSKQTILKQVAQSLLVQANMSPKSVLNLLTS